MERKYKVRKTVFRKRKIGQKLDGKMSKIKIIFNVVRAVILYK